MIQYWIYIYIFNSFLDASFSCIDGAFSNYISIDAIVVMSSYLFIESLGIHIMNIGCRAYTVLQSNAKNCLLLNLLAASLWGVLVASTSSYIPLLFDLTDEQWELMSQVLLCYAAFCPVEGLGRMCGKYGLFKCYNRLSLISNAVTWAVILLTDWLAVKFGFGCVGIVFATGLSWLLHFVIMFLGTKFWTDSDRIRISSLKHAFLVGKDYTISSVAQRLANVAFGHFASTMGTEQYAIYSIAYNTFTNAEELRCAYFNYCIVRLKNRNRYKERKAKRIYKQVSFLGFLLPVCLAVGLVCISHGVIELKSALMGVLLFVPVALLFPFYDLLDAFAVSRGKTKYALGSAVITIVARAGLPFIFSCLVDLNIYLIVLCYFLDYFGRTCWLFYKLKCDKRKRLKTYNTEIINKY